MLKIFLLAGVAFLFPGAGEAEAGVGCAIPPEQRAILREGENWVPSPEEAEMALVAVCEFLRQRSGGGEGHDPYAERILQKFGSYRVQFIGEVKAGKKIILCNFFPLSGDRPRWKRERVWVLDGGTEYWQVSVDPASGHCLEFVHSGDCC
jgi:hypothetical protein